MKCFHHNDADGRCAAAIINKFIRRDIDFIKIEYGDNFDPTIIEIGEKVYILDFSFKPEVMSKIIARTEDIVWIDHHKTALEYDYGRTLEGIRDIGKAACVLTWIYCTETDRDIPYAVQLIGDYDTWTWAHGDATARFHEGLRTVPHGPTDIIWEKLLEDNTIKASFLIQVGEIAIRWRDGFCQDYRKAMGFITEFEGLRCYAMNLRHLGSKAFGNLIEEFDALIAFGFDGEKWIISMYTERKDIDLGEICKKYGGGGHPGAAGFPWGRGTLPFKKIKEKE